MHESHVECMRVDRSAQGQMKHHFPLWAWMMDKGLQPAEFDEGGEAGLENGIKKTQVLGVLKQDATLSRGQPRDAPYITSVLTPILPLTLSLSITYNNRHVSHYYGQLAMIK